MNQQHGGSVRPDPSDEAYDLEVTGWEDEQQNVRARAIKAVGAFLHHQSDKRVIIVSTMVACVLVVWGIRDSPGFALAICLSLLLYSGGLWYGHNKNERIEAERPHEPRNEFEVPRDAGRIERVDRRELLRGPTTIVGSLRPVDPRDTVGSQDRAEDQRGRA